MKTGGWKIEYSSVKGVRSYSILDSPPSILALFLCALSLFCGLSSSTYANKVTIRDDRTLLIDDRPFFPIGLYYPEEEIADETGELLKDLSATGFNTVFYHTGGKPLDVVRQELDRIAAAGLHTQFRPPGQLQFQFDELRETVAAFKDHPAMLFWEHGDEPMVNKVPFEACEPGYRLMKELDPDHPVLLVEYPYWHNEAELKQWATICDVYAFDKYPIPLERWHYQGDEIPHGWPHSIAIMGEVTAWWQTLAPGKPIISILQAWNRRPETDGKAGYPTVEQSRFMAYQCVIRGAKGILYYGKIRVSEPHTASGLPAEIDPDPAVTQKRFEQAKALNDEFWREFRPVVKELSDMTPVFTAPDAESRPQVKIIEPADFKATDVQLCVKEVPGAGPVILMVNAADRPVRVQVTAPGFADGIHGWRGTDAPLVEEQGTFSATLDPYAVHIYAAMAEKP